MCVGDLYGQTITGIILYRTQEAQTGVEIVSRVYYFFFLRVNNISFVSLAQPVPTIDFSTARPNNPERVLLLLFPIERDSWCYDSTLQLQRKAPRYSCLYISINYSTEWFVKAVCDIEAPTLYRQSYYSEQLW